MSGTVPLSENPAASVDSSVTRLLMYTKELLENLTQWAHHQSSEEDVSDVYVRLGNEFNLACRSFQSAGIETRDLGDVPGDLRVILEKALAEDASEANLNKYLPGIRELIVTLLRRLKHKQALARQGVRAGTQSPTPETGPIKTSMVGQPVPAHVPQTRASPASSVYSGAPKISSPTFGGGPFSKAAPQVPQHSSTHSFHAGNPPPRPQHPGGSITGAPQVHSRKVSTSSSASSGMSAGSTSSRQSGSPKRGGAQTTSQAPYVHAQTSAPAPSYGAIPRNKGRTLSSTSDINMREGSPATVAGSVASAGDSRASDSLAALQRSEALERRASKRFSAFHMNKIINGTPLLESTMLPTSAPHSSHPAEYTDSSVVDEISGVDRSRGPARVASKQLGSVPEAASAPGSRVASGSSIGKAIQPGSSVPQAAEEKTADSVKGDLSSATADGAKGPEEDPRDVSVDATSSIGDGSITGTPSPGQIAVFLRMGNKVRKGSLHSPPTLAAVRLQFVDRFGYTPTAAEVFPEMTIQDHSTGIEYELAEANILDLGDGALVTLKAKTEDENNIERQIKALNDKMELLMKRMDDPGASKTKLDSGTVPASRGGPAFGPRRPSAPGSSTLPAVPPRRLSSDTVDSVRQELAVVRQISSKAITAAREELEALREKVTALLTSGAGTGREFMQASQKKLKDDSDHLVAWFDDLQDLIESQRKDVATRGVRLPTKQLEAVDKQMSKAQQELKDLKQYIAREKPIWTKTWEAELDTVVQEQQFFNHQELLVNDLQADIESTRKTFELVEQYSTELTKNDIRRNIAPPPPIPENMGEIDARSAMLNEVQALNPNHDERVEAIERAERLRKRELEMRGEEFADELGDFVGENKLKQSGGVEEVERRRRERDAETRDEQARTEVEAQKQREAVKEQRRKERAEMKAAAAGTTGSEAEGAED